MAGNSDVFDVRRAARFAAALSLSAVLLAPVALAQNKPAAPAKAPDITGFWYDHRGDRIWIESKNGKVKMVAPLGRTFTGTQTGNTVDLTAPFRGSEVSAPTQVQDQVDARKATAHYVGTIEPSGMKIVGTETKPADIKWDENNNITTFKIGDSKVTLVSAIKINAFIPDVEANVRP